MKRAVLDRLLAARSAALPTALVTDVRSGEQWLAIGPDGGGSAAAPAEAADVVRQAIASGRSRLLEVDERRLFIEVFRPPPRLIIVGAVHIAEPLMRMAGLAGYAVTIVDPRRAFAGRAIFAEATMVEAWPDEALDRLAPDADTAVVTLTHDPKLDDPALARTLRSPAVYVGALGSRATHAKRLQRLREQGFAEEDLARIHAPVGLAIGALTPAEIALSVLAEITAVRRLGERP